VASQRLLLPCGCLWEKRRLGPQNCGRCSEICRQIKMWNHWEKKIIGGFNRFFKFRVSSIELAIALSYVSREMCFQTVNMWHNLSEGNSIKVAGGSSCQRFDFDIASDRKFGLYHFLLGANHSCEGGGGVGATQWLKEVTSLWKICQHGVVTKELKILQIICSKPFIIWDTISPRQASNHTSAICFDVGTILIRVAAFELLPGTQSITRVSAAVRPRGPLHRLRFAFHYNFSLFLLLVCSKKFTKQIQNCDEWKQRVALI